MRRALEPGNGGYGGSPCAHKCHFTFLTLPQAHSLLVNHICESPAPGAPNRLGWTWEVFAVYQVSLLRVLTALPGAPLSLLCQGGAEA